MAGDSYIVTNYHVRREGKGIFCHHFNFICALLYAANKLLHTLIQALEGSSRHSSKICASLRKVEGGVQPRCALHDAGGSHLCHFLPLLRPVLLLPRPSLQAAAGTQLQVGRMPLSTCSSLPNVCSNDPLRHTTMRRGCRSLHANYMLHLPNLAMPSHLPVPL